MYNLTPAQRGLLHAGESALRSAGLTIAAGVYQYVVTNGLNVPGLLGFLGIAFVAQLAMIDKSIRGNPQLSQAAQDTAQNLPAEIAQLPDVVHGLHFKLDNLIGFLTRPPVTQPASVQPSQTVSIMSPPVMSATVPQQAFPAPTLPPPSWTQQTPIV